MKWPIDSFDNTVTVWGLHIILKHISTLFFVHQVLEKFRKMKETEKKML